MKPSDFRHLERLRVRWAEVDLQKIVFNGHYLMYFDTAVGGYWRALGLPYQETMAALEGDLYMRKASLEYEASARYDEQLAVGIRSSRIGRSSMVFSAAVFRGAQRLVLGELTYVFADPRTQTSQPVPEALRQVLQAFEDGEPMVEVRCGPWSRLAAESGQLRQRVFAEEQGIDPGILVDAADPGAVHAVAFNRLGQALASGRLLAPEPGLAKIGRMATLAALRGGGLARAVLDALLDAARQRGDRRATLDAQASAAGFYARAGFVPEGPEFMEAGLPHVTMGRAV
jgi:YbgC/YbaW family acyl-CoA thioester hydrolase